MQRYILIFISIFLTSCATLINRKTYDLRLISKEPNLQVQIKDSIYKLPAKVNVKRSKNDLPIRLISDTLIRNIIIKSSPSPAFVYGNLLWAEFCPIGYLVDFTNKKRFYYGRTLDLKFKDTSTIIRPRLSRMYYNYFTKNYSTNKGQINIKNSLPWINSFYLQPKYETSKINTGFWGVSLGLEYFYRSNKFASITGNAVTDIFIPVPAAVDYKGNYENMSSIYLDMSDNYKFRRFSIGYGLNYAKNIWALKQGYFKTDSMREPVTRENQSIGISLNGYFQLGKYIFLGLIYRPSLININPIWELKYQHLISIDFGWKIRIKK
jgi:hypothetical protein